MGTGESAQRARSDAPLRIVDDALPRIGLPASQQDALVELLEIRVSEIAESLSPEGACVVLTGEPGSGKSYIAQAAAQLFETENDVQLDYVLVGASPERTVIGAVDTPVVHSELERITERAKQDFEQSDFLVIALDVDRYDHVSTLLLEELVRSRRVRLICTTHRITGAADRLVRNPDVAQHVVAPLTIEESEELLSKIFGTRAIARGILHRWHEATAGNQHALVTLALAADRRGVVQRASHTAWVTHRDDVPPVDFIEQLGPLTELERDVLDFVAYATPVQEPALFRILDSATVNSLLARHILSVHTDRNGLSALQTQLPIVGEALRAHLSPFKRVEIAARCFAALNSDETTITLTPGSRLRLVKFGAESGGFLPVDWIWQAMRQSSRTGDLPFALTLALAAMKHPLPQRSAEAIVQACNLAYFLGDHSSLVEALDALQELLADTERFAEVSFDVQAGLVIMSVRCHPVFQANPSAAVEHYEAWEQRWIAQGFEPKYLIQSCRVRTLAFAGRVRDALADTEHISDTTTLGAVWHSNSTRTFESLIRTQRGEFRTAISLAESARQIVQLSDPAPTSTGDLEGFALFLAHWARGTTHSTRQSLYDYATPRHDVQAVREQARTTELSIALFATQEGRWVEAAELIEPLIKELSENDPFRLMAFAQAVRALIYATLGDRQTAYAALNLASAPTPGLSRTLYGFVGLLSLRARHWLRDPSIKDQALTLADWAARQQLPLIELEALDIFAHEAGVAGRDIVERAEEIAVEIDQPIGETLLTHIRALTRSNPEELVPEERLLSELGVWLPLPPTESLTGREREIALFTALGYASKQVAERLHLSARTVETHLSHVYAKLAITNREDLRSWFAQSREQTV